MSRIKVAVLRGGPSSAYADSLRTGSHVLSLLREMPEEYEPVDIFISRQGDWHRAGLVEESHKILLRADAVWNALGEDGKAQSLLEKLRIPYVGSSPAASAFARNKEMAKSLYRMHDIPTPQSVVVSEEGTSYEDLIRIFRTFLHPVIVKPASGSGAAGVMLAYTFEELKIALIRCFAHSPKAIIEEYVKGTVVSAAVVERARGEALYALVPAYLETHYRRVRPLPEQNRKMEELAKKAHDALGLRHYSSSDFVVTPRGNIYMLETNSQPVFHEDSLLQRSLESSGWQPREFVSHSIKLTLGQ